MTQMPATPLSLVSTIIQIFKVYPTVFACTWLLVAFSAAVHLVIPWIFLLNYTFGGVVFIGFILFTWFLYTAIICRANEALLGGSMKFSTAFQLARQRYLAVLGSNIIFFAIGVIILLLEFALNLLFDIINQHPVFVAVSLAINIYIFVMLYFSIPLIALDNVPIMAAFERSVRLVKRHWWRTVIVLFIVALFVLGFEALGILFTGKSRIVLFTGVHFLIQFILYPLIIAATLILLNDLKLRYQSAKIP
jgi:hypothetical protein